MKTKNTNTRKPLIEQSPVSAPMPLAMRQAQTSDKEVLTIAVYHVPLNNPSEFGDSGWRIRAVTPGQSPVWNGEMDATVSRIPMNLLAEQLLMSAELDVIGAATSEGLMPARVR